MLKKVQGAIGAAWAKSKAVAMSMAVAASLSLPAFATEGSGSGGDLSSIVESTDTITTMMGKAWTMILSNPLTKTQAAAGLLSLGIGFFAYLRHSVRH